MALIFLLSGLLFFNQIATEMDPHFRSPFQSMHAFLFSLTTNPLPATTVTPYTSCPPLFSLQHVCLSGTLRIYLCMYIFIQHSLSPLEYKIHEIKDSVHVSAVSLAPRMDPDHNECSTNTCGMNGCIILAIPLGIQYLPIFSPCRLRGHLGSNWVSSSNGSNRNN